jgi:octanoyl-[GcvH]:protein N-octanoyltransferase
VTGPFGDAPVRVVRDGSTTPQQDMDLSPQLLAAFADPDVAGRLRVHSPRPTAAFSRLDSLAAGFPAAEEAARTHGFAPVIRPAGGRLAAYHEGALVLDLVARHGQARGDYRERFAVLGERVAAGLCALGVPAQLGPVPGEYCPGEFSVNAGGATKIVGTAQRITRYGYLFSTVVLVTDPEPVREVLVDAYAALGMDWRPASVGCVTDHVPGVGVSDVERALLPELRELLPGLVDDEATPERYVRK